MASTRVCGAFLLLIGFLFTTGNVLAVPPVNDQCSGAELIPGGGPFPYTTSSTDLTEATTVGDPPLPDCQTNVTRSVWYRFVPSNAGYYEFSTCASAPTSTTENDTVMAIYQAGSCGGPFTLVACVDDTCGYQSAVITQLQAGLNYYVVVWQFNEDSPTAGRVQIRVNRLLPPANDTCAGAIALTLNIPTSGSTVLANNNYQLASTACFTGVGQRPSLGAGNDVVFSFLTPAAGNYLFQVLNFVGAGDLVLYLSDGCPAGTLTTVNCLAAANRSTVSSAEAIVCVPLAAGQQVYLFVDEHSASIGSDFQVVVTTCHEEVEDNNTPEVATPVQSGQVGRIGSSGDRDFYLLGNFGEGCRAFVMVDGEAANMTDFTLRVTSAEDTLEYDENDNDQQFGNLSPNIAGTPLPGGPAYAMVNFEAPGANLGVGPYQLYAVVQPPFEAATVEVEPNDALAQATRAPNNYYRGTLSGAAPSTDLDSFAFEVKAGDLIFVSLDCDPLRDLTPIDARLDLLDNAGRALLRVDDSASTSDTNTTRFLLTAYAPYSPGEALVYHANRTGTYYVRVSLGSGVGNTSIGAGDYLLSIALNCQIGPGPNVPAPRFLPVERAGDDGVRLRLEGTPGASYRIISSDTVPGGLTWHYGVIGVDGRWTMETPMAGADSRRYFRAVWP